eukprot:24907-Eustigmatos_ZCMA.PRE.1
MKGYRARNKQHTGTSPIYYNDYYEDSQCGRNSPVYHNDLQVWHMYIHTGRYMYYACRNTT